MSSFLCIHNSSRLYEQGAEVGKMQIDALGGFFAESALLLLLYCVPEYLSMFFRASPRLFPTSVFTGFLAQTVVK